MSVTLMPVNRVYVLAARLLGRGNAEREFALVSRFTFRAVCASIWLSRKVTCRLLGHRMGTQGLQLLTPPPCRMCERCKGFFPD